MPRSFATLIINCVSSLENRIQFRDFLYAKYIVILLIQEVASYCVYDILGYKSMTHYDNDIEQSGTAFVFRDGTTFTDIKRHPTGQATVEWIGSNRWPERENFFNTKVIYFLQRTPNTLF